MAWVGTSNSNSRSSSTFYSQRPHQQDSGISSSGHHLREINAFKGMTRGTAIKSSMQLPLVVHVTISSGSRNHPASSNNNGARKHSSRQLLLLQGEIGQRFLQASPPQRRLLQESDNTYGASTNARVISPPLLPSHTVVHSFTPETAEAIAHSDSR